MEKRYPVTNHSGSIGKSDRVWSLGYFDRLVLPEISAPSGDPTASSGWLYVKDDGGGTSALYFENDAGVATQLGSSATTAWDDITNPDANKTLTFGTYTVTFTGASTAADQWTFKNTGNFGNISVVRIEQSTGNPTDGTVLEVISADANCDALIVTANSTDVIAVTGAGALNITGDTTITGALSVTGTYSVDALSASTTNQTLALNGDGAGGVNIGSVSTGGITLGGTVTVADGKNVTIGEGYLVIDNDATDETALTITSAGTTAGGAINIVAATTTGDVVSITADDLGSGGAMIKLDSDNTAADNFYLECYDGAADDLTIGQYGAIAIAGNASTDIITVTAGNVQVTAGNIDVDNGKIEIDCDSDITSYIKRNEAVTTGPVLELEETAAAADNPVLLIDQNATAAASYGLEIDSAGGTCINVNPEAVTGDGIVFTVPASYTGQLIKVSDTLVGTTGEGCAIDIHTTANLADGATLVRLDFDTGTMAGAHNGFMLSIDDDSVNVGTSYAVEINSNSNEALIVSKGIASFTEQIICTAGIDSNAGLDVDLATNADLVNITHAAADLTAGDAPLTVYGSNASGQTNASYLLRLAWKANGDAQDNFILCEDNSTGAAGNGDDMFKVDSGGNVTTTGKVSIGTFMNLGAATEVTIEADGTLAITRSYHSVDTNADGATDDLDTIDATTEGDIVVLRANNSGRTVVVKNGTGNILCGADVTLDNVSDTITLLYDGANWIKIASSDNAA